MLPKHKSISQWIVILVMSFGSLHADDWYGWRGPGFDGVSRESNLPEKWGLGGANDLWNYSISGGSAPVIAGDRLYMFGYKGGGGDLREVLTCLDAVTGAPIWEHAFSDFISDIVYDRYGIGSPAIDPETGNVYFQTSPGLLIGFDRDGKKLWEHSLMEKFSRLTFPNGRTGGPIVDGNLVIIHAITANWGSNGPARDRFYAFDKHSGELVWYSTPGVQPKDSSFSPLVFDDVDGRRVFYSGTGCGNVVCVDARTGEALWRFQFSHGGVNSGVVLHGKGRLIAVHGKENLDSSTIGRMIALKIPTEFPPDQSYPIVLGADAELWRANQEAFTSTPAIHGDRVYITNKVGQLVCIDANTGKKHWKLKLAHDQLHASCIYGDGKLYVPMNGGKFFIVKAKDTEGEILSTTQLESTCLAAPSIANGRVYVHCQSKLYCFGSSKPLETAWKPVPAKAPSAVGQPVKLQIVPAEFALRSGHKQKFTVWGLDQYGHRVKEIKDAKWEKYIPPTAKVKVKVDAEIDDSGVLTAKYDAALSAGALKASVGDIWGTTRGRILQDLPYAEDFEWFTLSVKTKNGTPFSYPPLPWLGARMRWQVLEEGENKYIGNTLDRVLFQRSMNFIGDPQMSNYTIEADVMTDGNRRIRSTVGLVNQRYIISLIGNKRMIAVVSNHDRFKVTAPFDFKPKVWYHLKTRVDVNEDGSGVVRGKAWVRGESEPSDWSIEAEHKRVHTHGSPGIFAFSPQSMKKVFIDNISVTQN